MKLLFYFALLMLPLEYCLAENDLFNPRAWIGNYQDSKFGCSYSANYDCRLPSKDDLEKIKQDFLLKANNTIALLEEIKKFSYDNTSRELNRTATEYQNEVGENNFSRLLNEMASSNDTYFKNAFLKGRLENLDAVKKLLSNNSAYFKELNEIYNFMHSGASNKKIYKYIEALNSSDTSLTRYISSIKSQLQHTDTINIKNYIIGFGQASFAKYINFKGCTENKKYNFYPKNYFTIGGNRFLDGEHAPAFNIISTEHLQILKAMVTSKTTWTLPCEEYKEKDYDSTKFNIDEKSKTINFPYALTKCPWYSCDGSTSYGYDAINEKDFLKALNDAI